MKKILVGLSGGVDSAVAAYLLKQQGYEVVGGFMKNYLDEENPNCTTKIDSQEAIKVAKFLGIKLISFDFIQEYEERIIKYIYDSYEQGITPNPDILCNNLVKFDLFLEKALENGFDGIATGHYARIREKEGDYQLLRGIDHNKDQSYFLSGLNQHQLSKALFPIGELTKPEVRAIAEKIGLPNASRKDSQGLCFIGNIKIRNFLSERLTKKEGNIILTDGTVVGKHQGAYFFTIGQSRGLDINKKAYVCKIDVKNNILVVSYDRNDPLLYQQKIVLKNWHWISGERFLPSQEGQKETQKGQKESQEGQKNVTQSEAKSLEISSMDSSALPQNDKAGRKEKLQEGQIKCIAKIRYRHIPESAILEPQEDGTMIITFDQPQWGIAPGQSIVAYDGEVCLGGGIII